MYVKIQYLEGRGGGVVTSGNPSTGGQAQPLPNNPESGTREFGSADQVEKLKSDDHVRGCLLYTSPSPRD